MDGFAATLAWVRRANIARFRLALSGALPADQRLVIAKLLAAELKSAGPAAAPSTQTGGQRGTDPDGAPAKLPPIPKRVEPQ
jgi:hypothetical protein